MRYHSVHTRAQSCSFKSACDHAHGGAAAALRRLRAAVVVAAALALHALAPAEELGAADAAGSSPPEAVVRIFIEACVRPEGELTAAIDWAINEGFVPLDAEAHDARPLLRGRPGTVLTMPGSNAPVLLAVTTDRGCTVWAESLPGPALRLAFQQAVSKLVAHGARVQPLMERTVERAGAWRQQLQWLYRRAGGSADVAIGAVTTIGPTPAQQALHLAPPPPRPQVDAEGPAVSR